MLQNKNKSKGFIQGIVVAAAVLGILVSILIVAVIFKFYSDSEKGLSDRVYFGLSSINYFYLTEKNINEFAQIVTEITAKELGEQCGGFDCYSWRADNPSYNDLRNKFDSELRGKITGFPTQIGNGGRISFESPRISGLEMDEGNVKISLFPQQVYRKTDSFFVNASSDKQTGIDKNIRYLLLARIGQQLYGNGTYVRDSGRIWINSGKFDCDNDKKADKTIGARTRLSDSSLNNCKILNIDFNVDNIESGKSKWNSYGTNCYGIANSADPGEFAGKIEGGKIYVQIDSLLEKSLICGIDGTDGLAGMRDIYGETSKHGEGYTPSCSIDEAKNNAWNNAGIESKINSIMSILKNQISESYGGISINGEFNLNLQSGETAARTPAAGSESGCGCTFYDCGTGKACQSSQYCSVKICDNNLPTSCSAEYSSGWCGSSNSCSYSGDISEGSISKSNSNVCTTHRNSVSTSKNWYKTGYFLETKTIAGCGSYCYTPDYYCTLGAYFKFTFTPDISFKIVDTAGGKIVKKGTTDFEDLYFAVKFKPSTPYVIGE